MLENNVQLYKILYILNLRIGDTFYALVNHISPNHTVCPLCRVDDFTHVEGCIMLELGE